MPVIVIPSIQCSYKTISMKFVLRNPWRISAQALTFSRWTKDSTDWGYVKMADEEVNGESDEIQEKNQKKTAKYDSGAADLEKVTDYAEEKEISTKDFSGVSLRAAFTIM